MMQDTTLDASASDQPLRLAVLDADDLAVVSTLLQDAEVAVSEMAFLPRQARFALAPSRFDWPVARLGRFERCGVGLHFDRVMGVARSGFGLEPPDRVLRLLAMTFSPSEPPGGTVLLTFGGGEQVRLTVECIDAEMRDIGPRWAVAGLPEPLPLPAPGAGSAPSDVA